MKAESKLARQEEGPRGRSRDHVCVLAAVSEEEQERRIKEIHKIALKIGTKPR